MIRLASRRTLACPAVLLLLVACSRSPLGMSPGHQPGRFAGIGVFDAGRLWAQMTGAPAGPAAQAKVADDEHVIVVLDSRSGEVRECGDHSGYCVRLNPWAGAAAPALPAALAKHAADFDAEDHRGNTDEAENTAQTLR